MITIENVPAQSADDHDTAGRGWGAVQDGIRDGLADSDLDVGKVQPAQARPSGEFADAFSRLPSISWMGGNFELFVEVVQGESRCKLSAALCGWHALIVGQADFTRKGVSPNAAR